MPDSDPASLYPASSARRHQRLIAPGVVWATLGLMLAVAAVEMMLARKNIRLGREVGELGLLALAAAALILAVRRVRGWTRIADSFFPLVLLNPLLHNFRAPASDSMDRVMIATGLLGLVTAAIVAMRRENVMRYILVAALALTLTLVSNSFLMLVPAFVAWFLYAGYKLARSGIKGERVRGIVIMGLAEVLLVFFGLACILEEAPAALLPASPFQTIVQFTDFPLIVVAIMMLALGWRTGPQGTVPPHVIGMLALLMGMLALLLNNFQAGKLPPPGTDQTVMLLCLVYTVFALHGPRRLQWVVPPALLLAAAGYTLFR